MIRATSAARVSDYFADVEVQRRIGDYHAGPDGEAVERPGAWHGALAVSLGLTGDVTIDQLVRLLDGCHPLTGDRLIPFRKDRVAGHDLTFSAPKSVSVLWALGSTEVRSLVERAQTEAVAEAVGYIERYIPIVRRGANGVHVETAAEVLAAAFAHSVSRQTADQAAADLPPDPNLHVHVLFAMARRHDGRMVAVNSLALFRGRREIEAVYHASLATRLAEHGFEIERMTGKSKRYFEVAGIPQALRDDFSSRHREIAALRGEFVAEFREKHGRDPSEVEMRDLSIRTRVAKGRSYPHPAAFWRAVGEVHGITARTVDALRVHEVPPAASSMPALKAALLSSDGLTAEHATFNAAYLRIEALVRAAGILGVTDTQRVIADLSVGDELERLGDDLWTTREMLALEREVMEWRARRGCLVPVPAPGRDDLTAALRDRRLTAEQMVALRHALTRRFAAIRGEAGVGKGVVGAAAAHAWRAQGRRVFALAHQGRTAQQFASDLGSGTEAMTLDGFITRLEHGRIELRDDDVLAIDEAGQIGNRQWARLAAAVGDRATVVAFGDAGQLSPLSAGSLWPLLAEDGPRLQEVHRTRLRWERAAWRKLRDGDTIPALRAYAEHGHLTIRASRGTAIASAVAAWDRDGRKGLLVTDASNEERDEINRQAQEARIAAGEIGGESVRGLYVGDRVIFHAQVRPTNVSAVSSSLVVGKPSPGDAYSTDSPNGGIAATLIPRTHPKNLRVLEGRRIENGMTAEVVSVEGGTLTVRTHEPEPREVVLPEDADVGLAMCLHVYKAQGITAPKVFVVAGGWQTHRESFYVACSRARNGTFIFSDRESLGRISDADSIAELAERASRSRAKLAASHFLPRRRSTRRVLIDRRPLIDRWRRRVQLRNRRAELRAQREVGEYGELWWHGPGSVASMRDPLATVGARSLRGTPDRPSDLVASG